MKNLVIALILLVGFFFIFYNLAEVQDIVDTLQRGDWRFILLAVIVLVLWIMNVAASYKAVFRAIGLDEQIPRLFLLVASAYFLNIIAPSGGMGGIAVFITEARKKGYSSARVAIAGVLVVLFDYIAFILVLLLGLLVLFRRNHLSSIELVASSIIIFIAGVLAMLVFLGMRSAKEMGSVLGWMARQVNRILRPFIHRDYLSEARAFSFAYEASSGLQRIRHEPKNLFLPITLGISNKALLIVIFLLMFLAFKVPFSIGTLIAGFSIGYLFLIVSPTPAGIGIVESALTLGLGSLNVPLGSATVITLAYRGITFWIPLLIGMVSFRILSHGEPIPLEPNSP